MQDIVIHAMMIKPTFVLIERLPVVTIDDDQRIVRQAKFIDTCQYPLNGGIHIGDGAIILRCHVVGICQARWHPIGKKVAKGLEAPDRFHGAIG